MNTDLIVVGAGPVGLLSAYLARLCGLQVVIFDRSEGPLEVGRADALNARTLQLFEIVGLFGPLYPLGKPCNTSSVWANGGFVSRQSHWWESLEGCLHRHFLMLGQSYVEKLLDRKLSELGCPVRRGTEIQSLELSDSGCQVVTSTGDTLAGRYLIGADGSRSWVRERLEIPFAMVRPQIIWAVIDGVLDTDFPKVPEIIVFQNETSDVAWIPREGDLDRFYVRFDSHDFTFEQALEKIERAVQPHSIRFEKVVWFSQFSVKESVAAHYAVGRRAFLAGDACHVHSVNGGQGLNTGLADAFNLIWKLHWVMNHGADPALLDSYESERKPVAQSVIDSSGELVRATKFSEQGSHAEDYVKIVEKRAGNITGMGIRHGQGRFHDFELLHQGRAYSLLDYTRFSLFLFGALEGELRLPDGCQRVDVGEQGPPEYRGMAVLVRPDGYIEAMGPLQEAQELVSYLTRASIGEPSTSGRVTPSQ